jgi:hypothetical protein
MKNGRRACSPTENEQDEDHHDRRKAKPQVVRRIVRHAKYLHSTSDRRRSTFESRSGHYVLAVYSQTWPRVRSAISASRRKTRERSSVRIPAPRSTTTPAGLRDVRHRSVSSVNAYSQSPVGTARLAALDRATNNSGTTRMYANGFGVKLREGTGGALLPP